LSHIPSRRILAAVALVVVFSWAFLLNSHASSILTQSGTDPCSQSILAYPSGLHCNTTTMQQSDIIALANTPFTLVPAPGAGLVAFPIAFRWKYTFGTHPYQEPDVGGPNAYWQNNSNTFSYITWGQLNTNENFNGFYFAAFTSNKAFYGAGASILNPNTPQDPTFYTNQPIVAECTPPDSMNRGPILTLAANAAGTGYVVGDQVQTALDTGFVGAPVFTVSSTGGGGAVTGLSITSAGSIGLAGTGLATLNVGNVTSATVTAAHGGTLYAMGDTGTIDGCGNGDAIYQVTGETGGVVSSVSIVSGFGGATYTTTSGCTTNKNTGSGTGLELNTVAAGGSGLTVNTTAQTGDGTVTITVWYIVAAQ
jgi:hypothetical protein